MLEANLEKCVFPASVFPTVPISHQEFLSSHWDRTVGSHSTVTFYHIPVKHKSTEKFVGTSYDLVSI